jgi:membrane protein insertase Oxa1/YidC/SpoIIIJ
MPLLMGWMALTLASGLSLYFLVSNLFGIGQYAMLGKANWRNLLPKPKQAADAKLSVVKSSADPKPSGPKPETKTQESTSKPAKRPTAARTTRQRQLAMSKPAKKKQ